MDTDKTCWRCGRVLEIEEGPNDGLTVYHCPPCRADYTAEMLMVSDPGAASS